MAQKGAEGRIEVAGPFMLPTVALGTKVLGLESMTD